MNTVTQIDRNKASDLLSGIKKRIPVYIQVKGAVWRVKSIAGDYSYCTFYKTEPIDDNETAIVNLESETMFVVSDELLLG